jgi:DNA end-binding protein Ku
MASRTVWKGFIQFSLVAVPVKAYTATASGGGRISLNQLHKDCHSRINYKKSCPVHGDVPADQIVSGYEFAEGQYVVVESDELEKLRSAKEKSINIEGFIDAAAIDSAYLSGKTWYLTPDGPIAQKPYSLLRKVLTDSKRVGFARVVVSGRQQLVVLRPLGGLIAASMVSYCSEVKGIDEFEKEVVPVEVDPKEMQLAKTLTDSLVVRDFDLSAYKDDYTEKLTQLIEAKVAGKQIVEPPAEEPEQVINLMEALQKSISQEKSKASTTTGGKPPKLTAPGTAEKAAATRKRKTS